MNLVLHINLLIFVYHWWMRVMEDLYTCYWLGSEHSKHSITHILTYGICVTKWWYICICYENGIIYSDSSEISINHLIINRHFWWWLERKKAFNWWHYDAFDKSLPNIYLFMRWWILCVGVTLEICNGLMMILWKIDLNFEMLLCWFQYYSQHSYGQVYNNFCVETIVFGYNWKNSFVQRWWKCPNI